ncbi:MAG TPA: DUF6174 domain-containing protein [Anaerolineales bacterium]|nr:DUF6174 domain-containing protein [Anaerolineales bacterium]
MKKLLSVLIVLALAACSAGNQSEIERNREKWRDANISHYRFNLNIGCFCVFSQDMPLVIEVRDGQVVSMEYQNGNPIDAGNREFFERFATIDRVFAEVDADLAGAADKIVVTYDQTYGFPAQVNIDYVKEAIDEELALTVSGFEALR